MQDTREKDLETFRMWMAQLNHEDYLLVSRVLIGMIGQPVFVLGYIIAVHYDLGPVRQILVWSNLVIAVIIYISILAAFRVYLETRLKIRPLVEKHPDFPMRRLPGATPGLGLYCPVLLGLVMVVIWSSFLYVEAADDSHRSAAIKITVTLALVGLLFAIGVGTILGKPSKPAKMAGAAKTDADGQDAEH